MSPASELLIGEVRAGHAPSASAGAPEEPRSFDPAGRDLMAFVGITLFGFAAVYWSAVYIAKCRREAS